MAEDQPDEEKLRAEMKNKLQELVIEAREEEKNKKFKGSSCRTEVTVINDKIILENEKCLRKKAQGKKIEKSDKDEVASDDASDVDSAVKGGRTSVEKVGESPEVLAKTLFVGNVPTSCLEKVSLVN